MLVRPLPKGGGFFYGVKRRSPEMLAEIVESSSVSKISMEGVGVRVMGVGDCLI